MIKNRLEKNMKKHGQAMKRESIGAWRLYDRDIPEYPYIVESFHDINTDRNYAVVWSKTDAYIDAEEKKQNHRQELLDGVCEVLKIKPDHLIFKARERQVGEAQYEKLAQSSLFITVSEGNIKIKLNLTDYLDTGLFLDHRPIRRWIQKESQSGIRFLNYSHIPAG